MNAVNLSRYAKCNTTSVPLVQFIENIRTSDSCPCRIADTARLPLLLLTLIPYPLTGWQHAQHKQQCSLPLVRRRQHAEHPLATPVPVQLTRAPPAARLRHGKVIGLPPAPHYRQRKDICWYLRQCKAMSFPLLILSVFLLLDSEQKSVSLSLSLS